MKRKVIGFYLVFALDLVFSHTAFAISPPTYSYQTCPKQDPGYFACCLNNDNGMPTWNYFNSSSETNVCNFYGEAPATCVPSRFCRGTNTQPPPS